TLPRTDRTIPGNLKTVADLILSSNESIVKRCKLTPIEVADLMDTVCRDYVPDVVPLSELAQRTARFTTGDSQLDDALGGGICTGMLWEFVGESAAGKTQVGLQLSLSVQLPVEKRGLGGSCCYIKTSAQLPTGRLQQISQERPVLSSDDCSLDDVHTMSIPTIPGLLNVLTTTLPMFVQEVNANHARKPVKLLVIDALGELFHVAERTTSITLVERARHLTEISALLHAIASAHEIAVVVLNEVIEAIDRPHTARLSKDSSDLLYSEQARFFGRAETIPGEDRKEASLGLVWANQVNVRIMLTRTNRRRAVDDVAPRKRTRTASAAAPSSDEADADDFHRIRRLTVIFSAVGHPVSMDYIITTEGLVTLPGVEEPAGNPTAMSIRLMDSPASSKPLREGKKVALPPDGIVPLDIGYAQDTQEDEEYLMEGEDAEEEQMWASTAEAMPDDLYEQLLDIS
ncbi:P-loop containing nucleoside triphosphate hydrolase protein, partial [Schizophyllum fasciatum]